MTTKYLLSCPRGDKLEVDASQAGLLIVCERCGSEVTVPTYRGLASLERAVPTLPAKRRGEWSAKQGLALLGGILLIACLPLLYYTLKNSPVRPTLIIDEVMNVKELDQHPPALVYDLWVQLRDTPIDAEELPVMLAYEDNLEEHARWYWLIGVVGTIGFALVLAGIFLPPARRAPTVNE